MAATYMPGPGLKGEPMRLRVVGDPASPGHGPAIRVTDAETGRELPWRSLKLECDAEGVALLTVQLADVEVGLDARVEGPVEVIPNELRAP